MKARADGKFVVGEYVFSHKEDAEKYERGLNSTAKRWEYSVCDCRSYYPGSECSDGSYGGVDSDKLNEMGASGWELVCILLNGEECVFKRVIE